MPTPAAPPPAHATIPGSSAPCSSSCSGSPSAGTSSTEGLEKVESTRHGKQPFSAEIYLRNATGPLAPTSAACVPDVNGLALLDPARLKASWADDVDRIANHYGFDDDQKAKAEEAARAEPSAGPTYWFNDLENAEKRARSTTTTWPRSRRSSGTPTPCRSSASGPGTTRRTSTPTARS